MCPPHNKNEFLIRGHKKIEYGNKIPNKVSQKINYKDIANNIINLYETENKNNNLPDKLNETDIFLKKYSQMEEMVLYMIDLKKLLENEI